LTQTAIERVIAANSIWEMLDGAVQTYGDLVAFENYHNTLTFTDMGRYSDALAAYLQAKMGVVKGTKVALMSPNCLAHPVCTMAIHKCGGVQVSVNPMYTPDELEHQLNDADAEILMVFSGSLASFAPVRDRVGVTQVLVMELGDCGQNPLPSPPIPDGFENFTMLSEAMGQGASLPFAPVALTREDLAFLQYTGGTTGPSKGAMLTHGNLLCNVDQAHEIMHSVMVEREEIIVTALPMYHIFALMVNFICYTGFGCKNIMITNPRDMDQFIGAIKSSGFTRINGVNTLYAGMMLHPEFTRVDFSKLKLALAGGTATMHAVSDKWKSLTGKPILEAYGLSETSPALTLTDPSMNEFTGTIGQKVKDCEIRLLDHDDNDVPDGERGELVCKGVQVTQGYYNRPDATADAFTKDGFFRTGDIAIREASGMYRIVDRKKDMVIVSGFNVYPTDVEQAASKCEGIQECACIGVPDEVTGEATKLFVVRAQGSNIGAEDIIAYCRDHLTAYKVPKQIVFIDELPKSAVGKLLRRELRE
jgi:long-chain acyl-CoA synthetase